MSNPAVLIVEDDVELRNALSQTLENGTYPVITAASGTEAISILDANSVGLIVSDIQMKPMSGHELLSYVRKKHPNLPTILMTAYSTIENAVDVMRSGAADYLAKPFEANELVDVVDRYMRASTTADFPVAADPKTVDLLHMAARVASSDATVMLSGESGTGKEVFARFIHENSSRSDKPFIAINCAAIPENMLEAMLFGHDKGAFTGAASARAGKFEQANGGTLLLDEISEMDLGLQAKILRVIQEREVERIGGDKTISLKVRVLATSNRNLRQHVMKGKFREDLFYRLHVFPLHIPPLRERKGDIVPLAEMMIARMNEGTRIKPALSSCAIDALIAHQWSGNVRELENLIQRTLILFTGPVIRAPDLVFENDGPDMACTGSTGPGLQDGLRKSEFRMIVDALRDGGGNRKLTAEKLGISPRTLRYKLARMRAAGMALPDDLCKVTH